MTSQTISKHVHFDVSTQDYTSLNSRVQSSYDRTSRRYKPGRYASPKGYEKENNSLWNRGIDIEEGPDVYDKGPKIIDSCIAQLRAREWAMWLADVVYNEAFENLKVHDQH